jgi:DNA-directed RNA polymerase subunit RPC12/RpoP
MTDSEGDTDGAAPPGDADPAEAFDVLGNGTRIDILRALAESPGDPVTFSTLRQRVGMTDSGQFNYHLEKLVDRFVRKGEDGYELTTAGMLVHGAILSGAYTGGAAFDPIPLTDEGDDCPDCGSGLELRYAAERMRVACPDCDRLVASMPLPPGVLEGRDRAAIPETFDRYLRVVAEQLRDDFCLFCSGPLDARLERTAFPAFNLDDPAPLAVFECARCGRQVQSGPGALLLDHPAVVAFYHDHGRDVRERPVWQRPLMHWDGVTVTSEDPLEIEAALELDGDRLAIRLDESLGVVNVERESV